MEAAKAGEAQQASQRAGRTEARILGSL